MHKATSQAWQTHRCFFRQNWVVPIDSFLWISVLDGTYYGSFCHPAGFFIPVHKTQGSRCTFPTRPSQMKRKILSFLLCALHPQGLSSINTQRKSFYTNGNISQNLKFKLIDPDSTHNGHGWNELIITLRGGVGSHGQGGKDQSLGNKQMRY